MAHKLGLEDTDEQVRCSSGVHSQLALSSGETDDRSHMRGTKIAQVLSWGCETCCIQGTADDCELGADADRRKSTLLHRVEKFRVFELLPNRASFLPCMLDTVRI